MSQPTLGLLEKLRPPAGFKTLAALGSTYSLDLLTCMATLTALDGGDGEELRYGRVEAFRALDRLRDRIRICFQEGRIGRRDGARYPSLALLDRVLVPVGLDGPGSFHPKVWLVRQAGADGAERFVLVVSSRNVTTSTDWDLGMALEGRPGGSGARLPRVRAFAEHVLRLAGDPGRLETLGDLDAIRWALPKGIGAVEFDFQPGGHPGRLPHPVWSRLPEAPSRVLLLSPFIDATMIAESAKRWEHVPTRQLVAGVDNLTKVALGPKREALRALRPRQMGAAQETDDAAAPGHAPVLQDELIQDRPLHAKVIALDDGRKGTVILGSHNLTATGWCGGSTEAYLRLDGDVGLCAPLWAWASTRALDFTLPPEGTPVPEAPLLEQAKDALHALRFRLVDRDAGEPSTLSLVEPDILALPDPVRLEVVRYTMPGQAVPFPAGASAVSLPACTTARRTRFVVCTLRHGDEEAGWIATVEVEPAIGDERDRELVGQLLGYREFLAYLQALRDEACPPEPGEQGEGDEDDDQAAGRGQSPAAGEDVHLEGLLQQVASDPEAFAEMDGLVQRYGAALGQRLTEEDRTRFEQFLAAWAAIREAFGP